MSAPSRTKFRSCFGTASGVLAALLLSGCATTPRQPNSPPVEQALLVSAQQGNPRAQVNLGIYMLGRAHTPKERTAAVAWIRRAAHANLAMAQARLGSMYLYGQAVSQDTGRAVKWLRLAADRGAPAAQLQLADLYATGTLVPVDKAQAYYWYLIAAKPARSDVTIFNINQVRFFANERAQAMADSLTPAQQASVSRQVSAWIPTASVPYSAEMSLRGFVR